MDTMPQETEGVRQDLAGHPIHAREGALDHRQHQDGGLLPTAGGGLAYRKRPLPIAWAWALILTGGMVLVRLMRARVFEVLRMAMRQLGQSSRGYHRMLKLAWTIADLPGSAGIEARQSYRHPGGPLVLVAEHLRGEHHHTVRLPMEYLARRREALLAEARQALGEEVGADPDDLVYMTNVTLALNVVAHSVGLEPGDEVLSTDQEYGAMNNMWRYVCDKHGARYVCRQIPLPVQSAEQVIEAIWEGVSEHTRILFLSHITSGSALILPIEELIRRARERGILTVVDGAHAVGQIPLDLGALGVDFYAGNCHKWLMSPKGAGFLYVRRKVQHLAEPLVISGGFHELSDGRSRFVAQQEYQGTRDLSSFLSVPAAIEFAQKHHWEKVRLACHELLRYARHQLVAMSGIEPIVPDSPRWYAQMASLPLPPCDAATVARRGQNA